MTPAAQSAASGPYHYSKPVALMGHAPPWIIAIVFFFTAGGYLSSARRS